jgi:uncharacterized protein
MFSVSNLAIGCLAALIIGLSKTAVPGGGLLATPLFAMIVSGRLIAGITLPVLIVADMFAVRWYAQHAKREVLLPLIAPVAVGFLAGVAFFVRVGSGGRTLDVLIGVIVLVMVVIQSYRLFGPKQVTANVGEAALLVTNTIGVVGGFTTFVANAAGPVLNTYFTGLGLPKEPLIGTSGVFYFCVNLAKIPVYLLLGIFVSGGLFFTRETLLFDTYMLPAVLTGVFGGRWLLPRIPQRTFSIIVLILAALAAVRLMTKS